MKSLIRYPLDLFRAGLAEEHQCGTDPASVILFDPPPLGRSHHQSGGVSYVHFSAVGGFRSDFKDYRLMRRAQVVSVFFHNSKKANKARHPTPVSVIVYS
jgi:hypothetical protein